MAQSDRYVSVHIFYHTLDFRPLLVECIDPLITSLRSEALISRCFFIRYWMNGPHLRLRLACSAGSAASDMQRAIEPRIEAYFKQKPSRFAIDRTRFAVYMRRMFEMEYGKSALISQFGEDGEIPLAANNSFQYIDYQPEYGRYGGERGVALAEQHFDFSSSMVLELLRCEDRRLNSMVMGQSLQLMLQFVRGFYEERREIAGFFKMYSHTWRETQLENPALQEPNLDEAYLRHCKQLEERVRRMLALPAQITGSSRTLFGSWLSHAQWLAASIREMYESGELVLHPSAISEGMAVRRLLLNYVHMTNNRLGISISNEVYLAHLLGRALEKVL